MSSDARARAYYPALNALGLIIMIFGLLMSFPLVVSAWLGDGATLAYDQGLFVTFVAGLLLWAATRSKRRDLRVSDGFLLVAATWLLTPVFGALPLMLYLPELSFTDAYFEAASGLTTTGATVLTGLDNLPVSINLWRCFMHWVGGMGVIVLMVAVLPLLGIGGRQIFRAETPGPMKESSLTPRIAETAKGLWGVYVVLTVACAGALWQAGMAPWDAVIHAFSIMGLGGFSTRDASLGAFDSVPIETVTIVFALLSGINYATHYLALVHRTPRPYARDPELRWFFGVLAVTVVFLTVYLLEGGAYQDGGARVSPCLLPRGLARHLARAGDLRLHPVADVRAGLDPVPEQLRRLLRVDRRRHQDDARDHPLQAGAPRDRARAAPERGGAAAPWQPARFRQRAARGARLQLHVHGQHRRPDPDPGRFRLELITAFSGVVACLNNAGPGLGWSGPAGNYQGLSDFQTWVMSFAMILGRLEIFTLLVVLMPAFWRR
jgi:trk system potassium uptake protein TrkH